MTAAQMFAWSYWSARPWLALGLACLLRLGLGLGLYLAALQLCGPGGDPLNLLASWTASPDGVTYHHLARRLAEFWQGLTPGVNLKLPEKYLAYPLLLSGVYALLGSHPLWAMAINALCFLGAGGLARGLALGLGQGPGAALGLGLLVSLWPPSLAYGAVPLKDSLNILLGFLLLAGAARLWRLPEGRGPWTWLAALGLGAGAYLTADLRPDLTWLLAGWGLLASGAALLCGLAGGRRLAWLGALLALALLLGGLGLGRQAGPSRLLAGVPPAPAKTQAAKASQPAPRVNPNAPPPLGPEPAPPALAAPGAPWLSSLWQRRWEYASAGGASLSATAHQVPEGLADWLEMAATGARDFLFFPYPWQRWPAQERLSAPGAAVAAQQLLWYALLPGLFWGLGRLWPPRRPGAELAWGLALWLLAVGLSQALVVVNLGTLYRLRDLAWLPWLVLFSPEIYRKLWRKS